MKDTKKYRCFLVGWIFIISLLAGGLYYQICKESIPDRIFLVTNHSSEFDYRIPATGTISNEKKKIDCVNLKSKFRLKSAKNGSYTMDTKLFGFLNLKEVSIEAKTREKVVPSGQITGIYIETDGLFVIDTTEINTLHGNESPSKNKLRGGDYIIKINGKAVTSKLRFLEQINASKGRPIVLTIMRNKQLQKVKIKPYLDDSDQQYKIGAYIRNNTQGIGTITYTNGKKFAALGHGISDIDLGSLLSIKGGEIYKAEITSIKKGKAGFPGEIIGTIDYKDEYLNGSIEKNCENGIYGTLNKATKNQKEIPVALKQEVKKGKAEIISYISGKREKYQVEITQVDKGNRQKLKGMSIQVVDSKLKEKTNGIVQGMSGSPIIQNGKLVGAVTHVFVSNPAKGYAIFAETMIQEGAKK